MKVNCGKSWETRRWERYTARVVRLKDWHDVFVIRKRFQQTCYVFHTLQRKYTYLSDGKWHVEWRDPDDMTILYSGYTSHLPV